jgi:putative tricarboxylic transport membrane protein
MQDSTPTATATGPSHRTVELGTAAAIGVLGLIVIAGSLQVGINWGVEGPKAGFFPFYIGLLIVVASLVNFIRAYGEGRSERLFAEWGQLRLVTAVVIPTVGYVAVLPSIGIYLASALLIGVFMRWLGRYGWTMVLAIALGVPVAFYVVFERYFLVPLPKGPLEDWLGL